MKLLKVLPSLVLIFLAFPTHQLKAQSAEPRILADTPPQQQGTQQITQDELQEYVNQLSKELPMTLEKSIRWDSVALAPRRVLVYNYTFLDPKVDSINSQQTAQIKQSIAESMCSNQDVKILLDNDVKFNFKYHGSGGNMLTEVFLNPSDCL